MSLLWETSVTHITYEWFLSCVDPSMLHQMSPLTETLNTKVTFERSVSRMRAEVLRKIATLCESLTANLTFVRFLSSVRTPMFIQMALPCETLCAQFTLVTFPLRFCTQFLIYIRFMLHHWYHAILSWKFALWYIHCWHTTVISFLAVNMLYWHTSSNKAFSTNNEFCTANKQTSRIGALTFKLATLQKPPALQRPTTFSRGPMTVSMFMVNWE